MNDIELKEYCEKNGIELTPELEALNKESRTKGEESGKKANVEGRLAREKKDLAKTIKADLAKEMGVESYEDISKTIKEHQDKEFKSKVKEEFSKIKVDIKDKYLEDILNKAGINAETDTKDYKKLIEGVQKEYSEMFGKDNDPTLKIPNAPEPLQIKQEQISYNENGEIDKSKITDQTTLKMVEVMK